MSKVLYNADCSVCNFEISHYKKYVDKQSIDIKFEDLNKTNLEPWGVNKDDATNASTNKSALIILYQG